MSEVALPESVAVVIRTGGADIWQNDQMNSGKLQRWAYNSEGLTLVEEPESASMGEAQTLYEFLDFANTNYLADKLAVTFWNHGGGSVGGVPEFRQISGGFQGGGPGEWLALFRHIYHGRVDSKTNKACDTLEVTGCKFNY